MQVIDDFKASTITGKIKQGTDGSADVTTDGFSSYASLEKDGVTSSHLAVVTDDKKSVGKVLPWVHIAISNAKRSILDTYHDIKAEFLQLYLNEFCYKFNRRYVGFRLFDRLELCACTYRADFKPFLMTVSAFCTPMATRAIVRVTSYNGFLQNLFSMLVPPSSLQVRKSGRCSCAGI